MIEDGLLCHEPQNCRGRRGGGDDVQETGRGGKSKENMAEMSSKQAKTGNFLIFVNTEQVSPQAVGQNAFSVQIIISNA